eukprot:scaffold48_cov311-Pinguiococcus_pyrenoidosus.AAC.251
MSGGDPREAAGRSFAYLLDDQGHRRVWLGGANVDVGQADQLEKNLKNGGGVKIVAQRFVHLLLRAAELAGEGQFLLPPELLPCLRQAPEGCLDVVEELHEGLLHVQHALHGGIPIIHGLVVPMLQEEEPQLAWTLLLQRRLDARSALSPGRLPVRIAHLPGRCLGDALPEGEVGGAALVLCALADIREHAFAFRQRLRVASHLRLHLRIRVAAGRAEALRVEVDTAVGLVGHAVVDDPLHVVNDLGHALAHSREHRGLLHCESAWQPRQSLVRRRSAPAPFSRSSSLTIEPAHVVQEAHLMLCGELSEGDAFLLGALDDLVIDVGDVHAHHDVVVEVILHDPPHRVEAHVGAGVTHVALVVHRRPALVPKHTSTRRIQRYKRRLQRASSSTPERLARQKDSNESSVPWTS